MKTLKIVALFALLLTTASYLNAKTEKVATDGKLTVTYYATNDSVYRVDTTTKSTNDAGETAFVTVINDGNGELLGTIARTVLTEETRDDKSTVYTTRDNPHRQARQLRDYHLLDHHRRRKGHDRRHRPERDPRRCDQGRDQSPAQGQGLRTGHLGELLIGTVVLPLSTTGAGFYGIQGNEQPSPRRQIRLTSDNDTEEDKT